ncbi:dynein axonemal heavy chain 1 [Ochlerotatus camptorhynchus]|uniref:dynein axonemal heavy chain 1 n=1 Tax=Ochlerotatus camptorhynchus TaxID=644619 RepID=UPI0031D0B740
MSYPELDWRASFQQQVNNRKSLFEIVISPRKSLKPPDGPGIKYKSDLLKSCKFQYIHKLAVQLSDPCELETILGQKHINNKLLYGLEPHPQLLSNKSFLPLEWFDDFEYDPMSVERWLSIDNLVAFALVQKRDSEEWVWHPVTVADYDRSSYLWTVMENGDCWEVPRVRLCFVYENPICFVERIRVALDNRSYAENRLRFYYLRQLVDVEDFFDPSANTEQRISQKSGKEALDAFKCIYRKVHIMLSLNLYLEQNKWLKINPVAVKLHKIDRSFKDNVRGMYDFSGRHASIRRIIMYSHPAVTQALEKVHYECEIVRRMALFSLDSNSSMTMAEFRTMNEAQLKRTMRYLKNGWIENITMQVHGSLLESGRGWFDVTVDKWTMYQFMKLYRLIEQIKFRMQTALRDMVQKSTEEYCHRLCDPCSLALSIEENFTWQGNLIDSPFDSGKRPVFNLLLEMGDDVPYYSTHPDEFSLCLETLFDEAVARTHDIQVIDPSLFGSLIFDPDLYLSSMGLIDPVIQQQKEHLALLYRKTIILLKAYAARFMEFKELFFTNLVEYIGTVRSSKTSLQVKEEISFQIRMCESLERTLPLSIVIGSFCINVHPLREALIQKRRELIAALLKMLTERLRVKTSDIVFDYNEIIRIMCEKPTSIEHIYEIRAFMETTPELLEKLEDRMKTVVFEYEILEYFRYALPDPDFYQKWHALAFPQKIMKQMISVYEFHEGEVDKFRKQQVSDEAGFGSRVEEVNVHISKFTTVYDVSKVAEVSIEVKKLWRTVQELMQYGETLNKRQDLFELPAIDLSNLFELRESFESFKNLWTFGAEYNNVEETWRENPLSSVAVDVVARIISQYKASFESLIDQFEEQPQIQDVVHTFLKRVKSFEPYLTVIKLLQHPLLEPIHWAQLAKSAGIKVKVSLATNFELFLANKIDQHLDMLRELIQKAEEQKDESERIQAEEEEIRRKEQEYMENRQMRRLQRTEI